LTPSATDPIEPPIERELEFAAAGIDGRSDRAIRLAVSIGGWLPQPGSGQTGQRWRALSALGTGDLTAARVIEAHTDALAILTEAAADPTVGAVPIADIGATGALTVTYLIPLFGVLWGALFLGETITLPMLAGGGLVVLGTVLVLRT